MAKGLSIAETKGDQDEKASFTNLKCSKSLRWDGGFVALRPVRWPTRGEGSVRFRDRREDIFSGRLRGQDRPESSGLPVDPYRGWEIELIRSDTQCAVPRRSGTGQAGLPASWRSLLSGTDLVRI